MTFRSFIPLKCIHCSLRTHVNYRTLLYRSISKHPAVRSEDVTFLSNNQTACWGLYPTTIDVCLTSDRESVIKLGHNGTGRCRMVGNTTVHLPRGMLISAHPAANAWMRAGPPVRYPVQCHCCLVAPTWQPKAFAPMWPRTPRRGASNVWMFAPSC